jgi:diguanylate cyclase (GGDEF)-like protein
MLASNQPTFLLASHEPALLSALEPVLNAAGARVEVVLSAEAALAAMTGPQPLGLALIDANLPGTEPDTTLFQLLANAHASASSHRFPVILVSDAVTGEWSNWLAEGIIDDLIRRSAEPSYWRLRVDMALRTHLRLRELETLRDSAALNAQTDSLTGIYNRAALLSMLFRETDRVQRMQTSLCLLLFDIDDFGHWNSRLGTEICDDLLCQTVARTTRLLRSYDLFGRVGKDEFLVVLPGCATDNAMMLAERLRLDVFSTPFHVGTQAIRLSACFGIASSEGRSPVVVLREAEQALQAAKDEGPESIQSGGHPCACAAPVTFLSPSSGDELLAW